MRPSSAFATRPPLVSACIIVKNEERDLPRCLASLPGLVDEVVVYDTGSTDATKDVVPSVAAELGIRLSLVEGYWDDDFSRARNACLAHCSGEWILVVDADETVRSDDPGWVRAQLASGEFDAYQVRVENSAEPASVRSPAVHAGMRLFRRGQGNWAGRVHETVVAAGGGALHAAYLVGLSVVHHGYHFGLGTSQGPSPRTLRNIRLAEQEVNDPTVGDRGYALANLARSLWAAGRSDEALERCRMAVSATDSRLVRRLAAATGAQVALSLRKCEDALEMVRVLRAASDPPHARADAIECSVRAAMGEHDAVVEVAGRLPARVLDEDGFEYSCHRFAGLAARSLVALGRPREASDVLLEALRGEGVLDVPVAELIGTVEAAGRPLADIAAAVPDERRLAVLAQTFVIDADMADRLLEAFFGLYPEDQAVLAAAIKVRERVVAERASAWSERLGAAGVE